MNWAKELTPTNRKKERERVKEKEGERSKRRKGLGGTRCDKMKERCKSRTLGTGTNLYVISVQLLILDYQSPILDYQTPILDSITYSRLNYLF